MNTTTRTNLALAACEGLSDQELLERGASGFKKMIERKRMYSAKFGTVSLALVAAGKKLMSQEAKVAELQAKLDEVTKKYDELLASMEPSGTAEADSVIASVMKKG